MKRKIIIAVVALCAQGAVAKDGGRVVVPSGTYLSGTVWLRSGVELHLAKGATLKGSTD